MKARFKNELVLDGMWMCVDMTSTSTYEFVNIYNKRTIKLSYRQVISVLNGKDTVGKIITRRIKTNVPFVTNNTKKLHSMLKHKYAKENKR